MDDKNQQSSLPEQSLFDSLNFHAGLIPTSTEHTKSSSINIYETDRRKSIIPKPNRPKISSKSNMTNNINHESISEQPQNIVNDLQMLNDKQAEIVDQSKRLSQIDEIDNEQSFDVFIIDNFIPFTGEPNVDQWLDQTEHKFNHLKIPRNLRFEAISLLVKGEAKRLYIQNRKEIQSFDDFYEFLLKHFNTSNSYSTYIKPHQITTDNTINLKPSSVVNLTNFTPQPTTTHLNWSCEVNLSRREPKWSSLIYVLPFNI